MTRTIRSFFRRSLPVIMMASMAIPAGAGSRNNTGVTNPDRPETKRSEVAEGEGKGFSSPYIVSPGDWRNDGIKMEGFRFVSSEGGWHATEVGACMMAPVYISSGLTINEFWVTVYDPDSTENIAIDLRRVDHLTGDVEILASVSSSGESGIQNPSATGIDHDVTSNNTYFLTSCSDSTSISVHQARIWFSE